MQDMSKLKEAKAKKSQAKQTEDLATRGALEFGTPTPQRNKKCRG
jgi:hypothetical protein